MVTKIMWSIVAVVTLVGATAANAENWNLPVAADAQAVKMAFFLDTTWHTVEGSVKELSGDIRLANPKNPQTIAATITIPVSALDTDSASRDEEMRDSMEAGRFPSIRVDMPQISPSCEERQLADGVACTYATKGTVTIRDVTLPIAMSGGIRRGDAGAILVDGTTQLDWSQFGVKDPSILIAKVDEQVKIEFEITLPRKKTAQ